MNDADSTEIPASRHEEEVVTLWIRAEMRRWQSWVFPVCSCTGVLFINVVVGILSFNPYAAVFIDLFLGDLLIYLLAGGAAISHTSAWLERKGLMEDLALSPLRSEQYAPIFFQGSLRRWLVAITAAQVMLILYMVAADKPAGGPNALWVGFLAVAASVFCAWFHYESVQLALMRTLAARLPVVQSSTPALLASLILMAVAIIAVGFSCGLGVGWIGIFFLMPVPFVILAIFKRELAFRYSREFHLALKNHKEFIGG